MKFRLAIAALLILPILVYAADQLNVKLGLWEITTVSQMSGTPPVPKELLDRMTPEQRARFDAMGAQAAGGTDVRKACVTAKDLEHPFGTNNNQPCRSTVVRGSSTSQEIHMQCGADNKGTGTLRINTPTPETMNGTLDMQIGAGENGMKVKATLKGKWLRASCEGADRN